MSESAEVPTPTIRCCGLPAPPLTAAAAAELAPLFRALGDPVRLRLLSLIAATDEVCVCDLTESVDVSAPTVSHHLKALRQAGLVHAHRRGTWVYYRAVPAALHRLGALLSEPLREPLREALPEPPQGPDPQASQDAGVLAQ